MNKTIIFCLGLLVVVFVVYFLVDNYTELKLTIVNQSAGTISVFANFENLDNILYEIEPGDSMDVFEYKKFNACDSCESHDYMSSAFRLKNNKNELMVFPIYLDGWNKEIIKRNNYLLLIHLKIRYCYNVSDSSFLDPRYKIEYSDTNSVFDMPTAEMVIIM